MRTFLKVMGIALLVPIGAYVIGVAAFELRKKYFDVRVEEMCAKDGGVKVLGRFEISQSDFLRLSGSYQRIPIPLETLAPPEYPVVSRAHETVIREGSPRVVRNEFLYVHRADGTVLATAVSYARIGGDFPSHAHQSSFSCPSSRAVIDGEKNIFVKGAKR